MPERTSGARCRRWCQPRPWAVGLAVTWGAFLFIFELLEGLSLYREVPGWWVALLPGAIVLLSVYIAWRWPLVGGAMLIAEGLRFIIPSILRGFGFSALVGGSLAAAGILFVVEWWRRGRRGA